MSVQIDEAPWKAGLRGARANLVPGLVLQAFAVALVVAYYRSTAFRQSLGGLANFHHDHALLYGIVATGLAGGAIPALYLRARRATRHRYTWLQAAFLTAVWSYKGFEVDLWYRILARLAGDDNHLTTVAAKVFLDQFVFCPLWAVPLMWFFYSWTELHFRIRPILADLAAPGWYRRRVIPWMISNLGVWLPTTCVIYTLPITLQLPLFNLVLCFYTLLLAHVSREPAPA